MGHRVFHLQCLGQSQTPPRNSAHRFNFKHIKSAAHTWARQSSRAHFTTVATKSTSQAEARTLTAHGRIHSRVPFLYTLEHMGGTFPADS